MTRELQTLVVFAPGGEVRMIVHEEESDPAGRFNPADPAWNPPGHVTVPMRRADYEALPSARNVGGRALHYDLANALAADVTSRNRTIGAAIRTKIDAEDARIVAMEAARTAVEEEILP